MFTGPIEDRHLIRERMSTYADAAFQRNIEAWLACWTDDAVWFIGGQEVTGKAALRAQWDVTWTIMDKMAFFTEVVQIAVEGDRAQARCYCHEILALKGGGVRRVVGQYDDQLVRARGQWLFARRDYTLFMAEA
jgi:ketosteroid isomerase-like protein